MVFSDFPEFIDTNKEKEDVNTNPRVYTTPMLYEQMFFLISKRCEWFITIVLPVTLCLYKHHGTMALVPTNVESANQTHWNFD